MAVPIVVGVVAGFMLQVLSALFLEFASGCCLDPQTASPLWYAILSSPLGALVSLAPGFIAGWLSRSNGILVGFVVGLLGNAIYSASFLTMWTSVIEDGAVVEMVIRLLALASSWALIGAAAGGTAQLLRSTYALERTRGG